MAGFMGNKFNETSNMDVEISVLSISQRRAWDLL